MGQRPVKQQRLAEARETARNAREVRERQARRRKASLPLISALGLVVVIAVVVAVIALQPKAAPVAANGPKNMVSGGIAFTGENGTVTPVETAGVTKAEDPKPTNWPEGDTRSHIQTYIDWTCPACQSFESEKSAAILKLVSSGQATLEVFPIAILDQHYSTNYSTRAANAAVCVANYAPNKFLDVQSGMLEYQSPEGTDGMSTTKILSVVDGAGLSNSDVDACIRGTSFRDWVTAETGRVTSDETLLSTTSGATGFSTPTIVVNGMVWDRSSDIDAFLAGKK